jgi:hypothetical protein
MQSPKSVSFEKLFTPQLTKLTFNPILGVKS